MQKAMLITGANSGLGFEAAKQLAKQGHEIILLCRNKRKRRSSPLLKSNRFQEIKTYTYTANLASQIY